MNKYQLEDPERVKIWNTYFSLSRISARALKKKMSRDFRLPRHHFEGGKLSVEEVDKLQLLTWCILAAESRASHLIHEAVEKHLISNTKENKYRNLSISGQWEILPKVFGQNTNVDFLKEPHDSIQQLSDLRKHLFHVNYGELKMQLDALTPDNVIKLFVNFVYAMEDMNVLIGRINKPRPEVHEIADPFRQIQ
jgi:hypothetical protein